MRADWHTVRVYDNAYGRNEMHRHTLTEVFHEDSFAEAMRAAREAVLAGYGTMIEGWQR
jgi:hypothetical protein